MVETILHDNPSRPFILRLTGVFVVVSLILLPLALWYAPVSLAALGASALLGLMLAAITLSAWRYHPHFWGRILSLLAVVVIVIGSLLIRNSSVSLPLRIRYPWWLAIQQLATILLVFSSVVFLAERVATWRRSGIVLLSVAIIGSIVWYRAEQSDPLLYPNATSAIVQDDAPPGARKMTYTTTASADQILTFYRTQLEQWGWQFTCSTALPSCESNITVGLDAPHDVYHRRSDTDLRGPTFEILVRSEGNGLQSIEVYDQTRGVPNQIGMP